MIYKITIPNWGKWQKDIDGHRAWIALDRNFLNDFKVREVLASCPDAMLCYIWILNHANKDGNLEIGEKVLWREWKVLANVQSNNFNVQKRVNLLVTAGLLKLETIPTEIEPSSKPQPTTPVEKLKPAPQQAPIQTDKQTKQTDKQPSLFSEPTKPPKPPPTPSRFEDFWTVYPKKVGKATCEKKWKSNQLDTIADTIITKVKAYQQTEQWKKGFILNPETFINQRRWEDDISTVKEPAKPKQWWEQPLDTRKIIPAHERQGGGGKLL